MAPPGSCHEPQQANARLRSPTQSSAPLPPDQRANDKTFSRTETLSSGDIGLLAGSCRCILSSSMTPTPATTTPDPTIAELIAGRRHLAMHAMDGLLIDDVPLNAIADAIGTPAWVYSASSIRR